MSPEEAKFILFKASAAYPNQIELEDETILVWVERLANIPFQRGVENLNQHIDTNDYFPKISNIIREDLKQLGFYDQLEQETAERFRLNDEWASKATDPPKELEMRWNQTE